MFGKRNAPAPSRFSRKPEPPRDEPRTPSEPPSPSPERRLPWHGDPAHAACNLATLTLPRTLPLLLQGMGASNAETVMAATGAIAGYAAQQSLLAQHGWALPPDIQTITVRSGDSFLFGESLNRALTGFSETDADEYLFSRAVGGAMAVGLPAAHSPDFERMLAHVSSNLGGPLEGLPSTGRSHQPACPVRPLLSELWPAVIPMFGGEVGEFRQFGPVPQRWWGALVAHPVATQIASLGDVVPPAIALTILMESAIYASKLTRL